MIGHHDSGRTDVQSKGPATIVLPQAQSRSARLALHRRLDAVLLCVEPGGRQFAVLMLERDGEHRDAGLQQADIAGSIGQDRYVRADAVFGFTAREGIVDYSYPLEPGCLAAVNQMIDLLECLVEVA